MNKKVKMVCDVGHHYKAGKEYVCIPKFAANLIRQGWAEDLGETEAKTSQSQGYPENETATPTAPQEPESKEDKKKDKKDNKK